MNKSANVTVELDDDAYAAFKEASEIVLKAGIRVPTSQLVQTMINAEMTPTESPQNRAEIFEMHLAAGWRTCRQRPRRRGRRQMPEIPSAAAAAKT